MSFSKTPGCSDSKCPPVVKAQENDNMNAAFVKENEAMHTPAKQLHTTSWFK